MSEFGFKSETVKVETSDGFNLMLLEDLVFARKDGTVIRNRAGSYIDGMSAPQITKIIPWMSDLCKKAFRPAGAHDGAFRGTLDVLTPKGDWMPIPLPLMDEQWCNELIKECMESVGCTAYEVLVVFEALQAAGKRAFTDDRRATK
jgi:hypothetical protein